MQAAIFGRQDVAVSKEPFFAGRSLGNLFYLLAFFQKNI